MRSVCLPFQLLRVVLKSVQATDVYTQHPFGPNSVCTLAWLVYVLNSLNEFKHLAKLQDPSDPSNMGHSVLTDTAIQFTSRISAGYSSSEYEI